MRLFILSLAILLVLIRGNLVYHQGLDADIIDGEQFAQRMDHVLEQYNIPSVTACILKRNKRGIWEMDWSGAYGRRIAIFPRLKANMNTLYAVGSITKVFVVTAVMQLVEKGKIDLDADINTYLPGRIRNPGLNYNDLEHPIPPITVRDLLSHCSGLPMTSLQFFTHHMDLSKLNFGIFENLNQLDAFLKEEEAWVHTDPNDPKKRVFIPPGEKYSYSNVGYLILGFIIEEVINKDRPVIMRMSWMDYVQQNILNPLGMDHTKFFWPALPKWAVNKAEGYVEKNYIRVANPYYAKDRPAGQDMSQFSFQPQRIPIKNVSFGFNYNVGGSAGQIKSTTPDLARFMIMQLNGGCGYSYNWRGDLMYDKQGRPREVRILTEASVQQMHTMRLVEPCIVKGINSGDDEPGIFRIAGYGLGWMRVNLGGRYWNSPWNPDVDPDLGVDWNRLKRGNIKKNSAVGLDIFGHGGDMPGYHASMFQVSDDLAIVYCTNECFSAEHHDESRIQPMRFKHYREIEDGAKPLESLDGALPHSLVKYSELNYLLLLKAASLNLK